MFYFQVSSTKRAFQVFSAIFWCLFAAGPLFGFAALKPYLIKEHVYENICYDTSIGNDNNHTNSTALLYQVSNFVNLYSAQTGKNAGVVSPKCAEQDMRLNLIFTVCAVLTNISALPIGYLLDNFGPKVCGLVGGSFIFTGTVILINTSRFVAESATDASASLSLSTTSSVDPFLIGYGLISLGGPFTFISSFHLSNAFPKYSGTILAVLTGAFDASSSVFLIYSTLNKLISNQNYYFSVADFFKVYLFVPLFIFSVQLFLMPTDSYKTVIHGERKAIEEEAVAASTAAEAEDEHSSNTSNNHASNANGEGEEGHEEVQEYVNAIQGELNERSALLPKKSRKATGMSSSNSRRSSLSDFLQAPTSQQEANRETVTSGGIFGIMHGKPIKQQFASLWFFLLAIFTTIQMLRLNYFISTINSQYTYLFQSHELATQLNKIFDIALPLGGLISIPFVGYYLDNFSTVVVTATLTSLSLFLGILGFIPKYFSAGVLNVCLFVVYRPFFYTTISDVAAKVFGFETFGIIYGTMMSVSGVVNFAQSYLDKLTHTVFQMNPGPINYSLVSLTLIFGGWTVLFIKYESDHYGKVKVQEALQHERGEEEEENAIV